MDNNSNSPQALYRFWDKNNTLLYIGISNNFLGRITQHTSTAEWFPQASYVTLEHFDSRLEVEQAEKNAIKSELPLYNKTHNPIYESHLKHWRKIKYGSKKVENPTQHSLLYSLQQEYRDTHTMAQATLLALQEINAYWGGIECEFCKQINANRQYGNIGKSYFQKVYDEVRGDSVCQ